MLERMTEPEITGWVSRLDEIHALLAPAAQQSHEAATSETVQRALAVVAELHAAMLRAEVRAVIGGHAADGRRG
jgi:hypothetical protein